MFGGFFLLVGWGIGLFMFLASNDVGAFEYIFVGGWTAFALAAMGSVHEVVLNKREGTARRRYGWFLLVRRRCYQLRDFDRVVVATRFYRTSDDPNKPSFTVDLAGDRRLNLRVFDHLSDARHLAGEVATYLNLPLRSDAQVR